MRSSGNDVMRILLRDLYTLWRVENTLNIISQVALRSNVRALFQKNLIIISKISNGILTESTGIANVSIAKRF